MARGPRHPFEGGAAQPAPGAGVNADAADFRGISKGKETDQERQGAETRRVSYTAGWNDADPLAGLLVLEEALNPAIRLGMEPG